jgi:hypothetical protein
MSYRLARRGWSNEHEPSVTVRGAYEADGETAELLGFVDMARLCVARYLNTDLEPKIERSDLPEDDHLARKVVRMLAGESVFISGYRTEFGLDWRAEVDWWHCREFIAMRNLRDYLEIEERLAPQKLAAAESIKGGALLASLQAPSAADDLLRSLLPAKAGSEVLPGVHAARARFNGAATDEERRGAIRDLAFILEGIRDELGDSLPTGKDNAALFQIANRFYIRHGKPDQLSDYDPVWLTWIFNLFESTAYAWLGLLIQARASAAER